MGKTTKQASQKILKVSQISYVLLALERKKSRGANTLHTEPIVTAYEGGTVRKELVCERAERLRFAYYETFDLVLSGKRKI